MMTTDDFYCSIESLHISNWSLCENRSECHIKILLNARGKINPTLSLKLPKWGAENPKTKTQVSQYGGQQRNKDGHPGQQDGSHVQVRITLILHFKTLQFIEDSKKTVKVNG